MCIQCCPGEIVQSSFIMVFSATECLTSLTKLNFYLCLIYTQWNNLCWKHPMYEIFYIIFTDSDFLRNVLEGFE